MKYLITGGAGFVGQHLCRKLLGEGGEVLVVDNFLNRKSRTLDLKIKLFDMDVSSPEMSSILGAEKPDVIYYLSGPINLRRDISDPLFTSGFDTLSGISRMAAGAVACGVKKFIFISSGGAIYSGAQKIPSNEDCKTIPDSLYGLANLICERILENCAEEKNLNYSVLRFSNIYGPGQWESGVVPSFIRQIKNKSLVINGDGKQTRDFIYIDDAVAALLLATRQGKSGVFNVGSGVETSLNEVSKKIAKILGVLIEPSYNFKKEKTMRSVLNCSKFKKELGWEPKVCFEEGLRKTIEHYESR